MALVHTSYHANPLESSRLSQRELLARIFGHHQAESEHHMDYEEGSSDSGSDYEMEDYNEGTISAFMLCKVEGKYGPFFLVKKKRKKETITRDARRRYVGFFTEEKIIN